MPLTIIDSASNTKEELPEWVSMYDIGVALKQLEANRARFRKENRTKPRKVYNYYVPTGKPRGRPRNNPLPESPAEPQPPAESSE